MTFLSTLSPHEMARFLKVIQDSLAINSHQDLFNWLHDEIQHFIPHDILLTAWGDFSLGLVHLDVVSYLSGVRTTEVDKLQLMPTLQDLFQRWEASNRAPISLSLNEENGNLNFGKPDGEFGSALALMRSAMVQGMKDERGRHDCLYVTLSANRRVTDEAVSALELLLPYMDAASRQVAHLPVQYPDFPELKADIDNGNDMANGGESGEAIPGKLSEREIEIMQWVCRGKTNSEIGQILDISFFTVKNHLQRIFRKLDVLNRAQAVSKIRNWFEKNPY
jgi:transcriptional regulator EpsA